MIAKPPPSKRQRREPDKNAITKLTGDEWLIIFDNLREEDPWFLSRLCLVSRAFRTLATPLLYRSVTLPRRLDDLTRKPDGLLRRLLADSHSQLRAYVQELTAPPAASYSTGQCDDFEDRDYLAQVVEKLPNLRLVRVMHPLPFTDRYIRSFENHPNKPKLHILAFQGWEKAPSRPLNFVSTIKASLLRERQRLPTDGDALPSMMLNFQKLFFSCPNLKSCSLTMFGPFENSDALATFEMTGEEIFPRLESLSLNGYFIRPNEWPHWRDRFSWSSLSSLEVGPQPDLADRLLHRLKGHTTSLKKFKITVWSGEDEAAAQENLEAFLYSFDTLETLEITNYVCPVEAIANHRNLVRLAVHLAEEWDSEEVIPSWNASDIYYLDDNCPSLEVLEIDFERQAGAWDSELLISIAKGFDCLRELCLHVRVGSVRGEEPPLTPVLNYQSAQEIGSTFFKSRKHSFDDYRSRMPNQKHDEFERLLLKTGVDWHLYNRFDRDQKVEELNKNTFELRKPTCNAGNLTLIHPERERIQAQNRQGYPGATAEKTRNVICAGEIGALHESYLGRINSPTQAE
ncbi:hypothetical protein N7533_007717 [Penicillium manginii]|uniref:uncharacterized protein n=1 Tax=Penicillium manginii TaxID=203109 RepID=UPI0025473815|nr:uncharacterized protein N7533_007717 [Penicillium manginii]KAJ5750689.1 hypothetical protein N7533_007717 [Penicillium manginii]